MRLERPGRQPLFTLLATWAVVVAGAWLLPGAAGLEPATGWLVFLTLQAVALGLAVAVAVVALRRRVDLTRLLLAGSLLPLLWGLGVACWLAGLLYLAS